MMIKTTITLTQMIFLKRFYNIKSIPIEFSSVHSIKNMKYLHAIIAWVLDYKEKPNFLNFKLQINLFELYFKGYSIRRRTCKRAVD